MERKWRWRDEKQKDKEEVQKHNHVHTATFDFETVLPTPYSLVNQAYYKRTLHLPFYCIPLVIEKDVLPFHIVKMYKDKEVKNVKNLFVNVWRKSIFDIYVTEYGTALTTILPILFLYLNTATVTAGTFEP